MKGGCEALSGRFVASVASATSGYVALGNGWQRRIAADLEDVEVAVVADAAAHQPHAVEVFPRGLSDGKLTCGHGPLLRAHGTNTDSKV